MRIKHQEELTELHKKRGEVSDGRGGRHPGFRLDRCLAVASRNFLLACFCLGSLLSVASAMSLHPVSSAEFCQLRRQTVT